MENGLDILARIAYIELTYGGLISRHLEYISKLPTPPTKKLKTKK